MKTICVSMVAALAAVATPARADDDAVARRALARLEHAEPSVRDTVAAALRYAGLAGRADAGLGRRARLSALLPVVAVKASRGTAWTDDGDGARAAGGVDRSDAVEVRATWRLDRLVFDGAELRVASLARQHARARAAVAADATSLYYKRRAAQVDVLWHPAPTVEEQVRRELELDELTAELDALTGGWWSEQAGP